MLFFLRCLLILMVTGLAAPLRAQQRQLVRVQTPAGQPVPFATLELVHLPDSMRQQRLSDSAGLAAFDVAAGERYLLRFSAVGYRAFERGITAKPHAATLVFGAEPESKSMNGVVVRAARPMIRQDDDKTIVDPENLVNASTNAFEVIEKTPGLFIDQDGNIYLSSTTPAIVYINGREQRMSAADMATLLKNLPPSAIASIEILRTPSARYDASGSGGIVNVVLKKGVRIGLTGSINAGGNQGEYGNQFAGLSINNNNGALTTYLNVNLGRRGSFEKLQSDRFFGLDSVLQQQSKTKYWGGNFFVGFGASYQLPRRWELSYDSRYSANQSNSRSTNLSLIGKVAGPDAFTNFTIVNNKGVNRNLAQSLNLKKKLDSAGSEWTTDLSYTFSPGETEQVFNTGDGNIDNRLRFFTAQSNLVRKLPRKLTLESGVKTMQVRFRNNTDYFRTGNGSRVPDLVRSRGFRYAEQIHSAFVQASKDVRGIVIKSGLRLEHTNMDGVQIKPNDTSFRIRRTDLFPYVYLSRNIMKIAGYDLRAYLVYRRTINRPGYELLNPSLRFVDPFVYETGNPSLRPQFTQNYEANISVDERPIIAIGQNRTNDIFTQVVYPSDTSARVTLRTYDNLGNNRETYFRLMGAIPPGKKYFGVVVAQYNRNFYQGRYENKELSFQRGSWTLFSHHSYKLTPLTQIAVNGFVRFNGQQQFYELKTFGELRVQLAQQLLHKKLTLALNLNDILGTNRIPFTLNQGSIRAEGLRRMDTQRIGINLRYNFGIRKKEENNVFNVDPDK